MFKYDLNTREDRQDSIYCTSDDPSVFGEMAHVCLRFRDLRRAFDLICKGANGKCCASVGIRYLSKVIRNKIQTQQDADSYIKGFDGLTRLILHRLRYTDAAECVAKYLAR